jgi:hypothetical protein
VVSGGTPSRPPSSNCWVRLAELDPGLRLGESRLHLDACVADAGKPKAETAA